MEKKNNLKDRAYKFSIEIVKLCNNELKNNFVLRDQLLRSGTSIAANIIEAQAGSGKKDFINFYHIALKSSNETKYWLSVIKDADISSSPKIQGMIFECEEISKILGASLITMKKNL